MFSRFVLYLGCPGSVPACHKPHLDISLDVKQQKKHRSCMCPYLSKIPCIYHDVYVGSHYQTL